MLKTRPASVVPIPAFIKGQLWKVGERCIQIGDVGKLLVEHRGMSLDQKRGLSFKRMGSIKELQKFFKVNDAVLMADSGVGVQRPRV
ncbi:MAG TPA: hypothetical protein VNT99_03580 [Methylomirabilota bacterium]|nr:hypothetical protein [Methylomirabilota bacterium]